MSSFISLQRSVFRSLSDNFILVILVGGCFTGLVRLGSKNLIPAHLTELLAVGLVALFFEVPMFCAISRLSGLSIRRIAGSGSGLFNVAMSFLCICALWVFMGTGLHQDKAIFILPFSALVYTAIFGQALAYATKRENLAFWKRAAIAVIHRIVPLFITLAIWTLIAFLAMGGASSFASSLLGPGFGHDLLEGILYGPLFFLPGFALANATEAIYRDTLAV